MKRPPDWGPFSFGAWSIKQNSAQFQIRLTSNNEMYSGHIRRLSEFFTFTECMIIFLWINYFNFIQVVDSTSE